MDKMMTIGGARVISAVLENCWHRNVPSPQTVKAKGLTYGTVIECPTCGAQLILTNDQRDGDYWKPRA